MRTIVVQDETFQAGGWLSGFGRTVRHRYSDWAQHRRASATARALQCATDMELRDMGISRGDIPAIVSGSTGRD